MMNDIAEYLHYYSSLRIWEARKAISNYQQSLVEPNQPGELLPHYRPAVDSTGRPSAETMANVEEKVPDRFSGTLFHGLSNRQETVHRRSGFCRPTRSPWQEESGRTSS